MNSLCVILARGGSKGIKNKNLASLCQKPLIQHTIEAAIESAVFDRVVVSTDDKRISEISIRAGAEVPFVRPHYLSEDDVLSKDALIHAVEECEKIYKCKFDIISELQCTSPMRNHVHIKEAFEIISNKKEIDSVISVRKLNHFHPLKIKKIINGKIIDLCDHFIEKQIGRRQDCEMFYTRNGAMFLMTRECILEKGNRVGDISLPYVMDDISSINIDNMIDLRLAEIFMDERSA
jgi:CMP-N-acetylneuraminic acid synthetase|tara:strand:- start:864 stop:1568 length:705 start_codon:yes stop_codon:yes gene_type:complete